MSREIPHGQVYLTSERARLPPVLTPRSGKPDHKALAPMVLPPIKSRLGRGLQKISFPDIKEDINNPELFEEDKNLEQPSAEGKSRKIPYIHLPFRGGTLAKGIRAGTPSARLNQKRIRSAQLRSLSNSFYQSEPQYERRHKKYYPYGDFDINIPFKKDKGDVLGGTSLLTRINEFYPDVDDERVFSEFLDNALKSTMEEIYRLYHQRQISFIIDDVLIGSQEAFLITHSPPLTSDIINVYDTINEFMILLEHTMFRKKGLIPYLEKHVPKSIPISLE